MYIYIILAYMCIYIIYIYYIYIYIYIYIYTAYRQLTKKKEIFFPPLSKYFMYPLI